MNKRAYLIPLSLARIAFGSLFAIIVALVVPSATQAQATKFTSETGGYSVIFPAPAENVSGAPQSAAGEKFGLAPGTTVNWSVELRRVIFENQIFISGYTRYSGPGLLMNTEKELKANQDNFLKGLEAQLTSSRGTEYLRASGGKISGLEFVGETKELTVQGKCFVLGNEVWAVFYITRKENESAAARDQFYRSLEIRR